MLSGSNIELCYTPVVILSYSIKVLFAPSLCFLFVKWLSLYFGESILNPNASP